MFTNPEDYLLCNSEGQDPLLNLEECYDQMNFDLDTKLHEEASAWCEKNHYLSLDDAIAEDQRDNTDKYMIQSVVGDDEETTSDSASLGPLLIVTGPVISRVKLSEKDTGISKEIGNYAEGWILMPPTAESTFEAVNRRHVRNGVPYTLDGVKLKLTSAVRKQSILETDLESKIRKVCEHASWVNPNWFTYDYHQMMILLAVNTFDFRDSRSFPYLFGTEGGCGGLPPYGNPDTTMSAIHAFHKGKAKRTIYGLMQESYDCHIGVTKPNETFFIRSSHIAQMGDKAWLTYDQVYRSLLKGTTSTHAKHKLNVLADKDSLPADLLEKGAEISPESTVIGTALSHLREDSFIMTELDVKMFLENEKKISALSGNVPYEKILEDIKKEKEAYKSNSWKVLGRLSELFTGEEYRSLAAIEELPSLVEDYSSKWEIMRNYYAMRSERHAYFTSFSYTDAIRVFKTSDVLDYVRRKGNVLRTDIAYQVDPALHTAFLTDIVAERLRKESVFQWLNSADLEELLKQPLPPGVGPDDPRIYLQFLKELDDLTVEECNMAPPVFIVVTGDTRMCQSIYQKYIAVHGDKKFVLLQIKPMQYISLCLENLKEISLNYKTKEEGIVLWNYITGVHFSLNPRAMSDIRLIVRKTYPGQLFKPIVEYDYPNLERSIEPTRFDPSTNTVAVQNGGFLSATFLNHLHKTVSWSTLPVREIKKWPDFNRSLVTRYSMKGISRLGSWVNRPNRPELYRAISSWAQGLS
jgi:hypothetical protein